MIKVNLTQRIWLAFISLILLVGLSITIVYPLSIKGTLTEETYRMIEQIQSQNIINPSEFNPQQISMSLLMHKINLEL
ncbi:hypothetical protein [Alkalicoccobacillus plakortidis]|uniref:hypothetical protein n=1 Tax=Alkalicoccobacillus plakortidis TaxID=444060 RepID=UPI0027D99943|nr:hypothetical protein [Alkalicoccobacillus plakortidis]